MDFDPRDCDDTRDRNDERAEIEPSRGRRGSSGTHDRDDDWRQLDVAVGVGQDQALHRTSARFHRLSDRRRRDALEDHVGRRTAWWICISTSVQEVSLLRNAPGPRCSKGPPMPISIIHSLTSRDCLDCGARQGMKLTRTSQPRLPSLYRSSTCAITVASR